VSRGRVNEWGKQLYRDLDDKHMLIPAIALLVAIIAVPLLLGGGSATPTATPVAAAVESAPAAMTGSEQIDPVVLADVPGIRDYHQRLDQFDARNPFEQQMTGGTGKSASGTGGTGTGGGTGGGSSSSTSSSSSSTSSSTSTDGSSSVTPPSTTPDTGNNGGGTEIKFFQIQLDVKVGPPGKAKVLEGVAPLTYLPGKETPVVQYVQGDLSASKAAFIVSPAVVTTDGDGNCKPGRNDCQFLLMKKGDEQTFEYGDNLRPYKLKILDISRVEVTPKDAKELGKDARQTSDAAAHFVASMDN